MSQPLVPGRPANHLLRAFSGDDFALIEPHLEPVALKLRQVIEEPHKPIEHVCFVESGLLSVVASAGGEHRIEVGLIGWEGVNGLPLIMGDDRSPYNTFVQIAGHARRLKAGLFRGRHRKRVPPSTACCCITPRASCPRPPRPRWPAMAAPRLKRAWRTGCRWRMTVPRMTEIHLTHEFLALMLGVNRPGVTVALQNLAGTCGLTPALTRSVVSIIDRKGMEKVAGGLLWRAGSGTVQQAGQAGARTSADAARFHCRKNNTVFLDWTRYGFSACG